MTGVYFFSDPVRRFTATSAPQHWISSPTKILSPAIPGGLKQLKHRKVLQKVINAAMLDMNFSSETMPLLAEFQRPQMDESSAATAPPLVECVFGNVG